MVHPFKMYLHIHVSAITASEIMPTSYSGNTGDLYSSDVGSIPTFGTKGETC